jgi:hypothetical protein
MGEINDINKPVQERRPVEAEGVPAEEDVDMADAAERVDLDPEEQRNRPDQPGMTEDEERQYDEPPMERPIADADRPEDR